VCFGLFQITSGGKADGKGICSGDSLIAINGQSTEGMTHIEAQNAIKRSQTLKLNLNR
jgi:C-terminal processing protease CtpA/Prc